ncbi:MAG: hypothetical protein RLO80_12305 [Hyphomonas sp.]
MARQRDYKAEYARRVARGAARGLSRSQARGHPKAKERAASYKPDRPNRKPPTDPALEAAILAMNRGESLTQAARDARVSPERLRRYLVSQSLATKKGASWVIADKRPRQVPMIKQARTKPVVVPGFDEASRVGSYHNAIGQFLRSQDLSALEPFRGQGVKDTQGRFHPFETDPNALISYALKDEPEFHEIYQIIQT